MADSETIHITGMSCGHCVKAVEQALRDVPGIEVREVTIGTATVVYSGANRQTVVDAIEEAGYSVA